MYHISAVDFTQIDGAGVLTVAEVLTVWTLLSELGLDPSRFPTSKHFVSWLSLYPGDRLSGGKRKSSKTRSMTNRVATALLSHASPSSLSKGDRSGSSYGSHLLSLVNLKGHLRPPWNDCYKRQHQEWITTISRKVQALGFDLLLKTPQERVSG
ncbi:IS110 family transposase [Phormidium tenue FACHB-886]|nr:IS110 family transposase [Phormidium tenue FACHB-886]